MSNHTGKFLTQWQMAEAKRHEAWQNSQQKRNGTNHPMSNIIAWSCGCCIGPVLKRDETILTPEQADAVLKLRKTLSSNDYHDIKLSVEWMKKGYLTYNPLPSIQRKLAKYNQPSITTAELRALM